MFKAAFSGRLLDPLPPLVRMGLVAEPPSCSGLVKPEQKISSDRIFWAYLGLGSSVRCFMASHAASFLTWCLASKEEEGVNPKVSLTKKPLVLIPSYLSQFH